MRHDQRAQTACIGQATRQHLGVGGDPVAVGKGDRACVFQKSDLDHLAAFAAFGQSGHGEHVDRCRFLRTAGHEFQGFGAVDRGKRVGPRDHRCDTPGGSGGACGAEAFLVTFARLADFHTDIDDARRQHLATAVGAVAIPFAYFGDAACLNPEPAFGFGVGLRVDQAQVGQDLWRHWDAPCPAKRA